jgi:hypothetical protein
MIIIPYDLTVQEIRVLQEFRRLTTETLTLEAVKNIKHPAGGGEGPAASLASKGYLAAASDSFSLTEKGKQFLSIQAAPAEDAPVATKGAEAPEAV